MGFFSNIFGSSKPKVSTDGKNYEYLAIFKEASMAMVPHDKQQDERIYRYFFGAVDALAQSQKMNEADTMTMFITFLIMDLNIEGGKAGSIFQNIISNQTSPDYSSIIMIGGSAMYDWSNGDQNAPMKLSMLFTSVE